MISETGFPKTEVSLRGPTVQVVSGVCQSDPARFSFFIGHNFVANKLGSCSQPTQPAKSRITVGCGVFPTFNHTVVVTVNNKGPPELSDSVIVQSQVVAGNGTPRKSCQNQAAWISSVVLTNPIYCPLAIIQRSGRIIAGWITPPSANIGCSQLVQIGQ